MCVYCIQDDLEKLKEELAEAEKCGSFVQVKSILKVVQDMIDRIDKMED